MRLVAFLTGLVATLVMGTALGATKADSRVEAATAVIQKFNAIPEKGIPPSLLKEAHGIAVLPNVIKAGFVIGGRHGKGVLVVRQSDGRWGNPAFISLSGGSIGWQIGAQGTDLILVFKSQKSVENIAKGKFTLGADAAAAAGPVGRSTSAGTDVTFKSEIYSYSRSRGLFAGVSLEGAALSMDLKSNQAFYPNTQGDAMRILTDTNIPAPQSAQRFVDTITTVAPRVAMDDGPKSSEVKTYAVEEAESASSGLTL